MKKILVLLTLTLSICATASAQKCNKVLKEKKDAFSSKPEKTARVVFGNLTTRWLFDFSYIDGTSTVTLGIAMRGEFNQRLEVGTKLLLKLEDETVMTLETIEPTSPVTQVASGGAGTANIFTQYNLKFGLDEESINKLAASTITALKVDIPGQAIKNPPIKSKQMENVKDVFICLKQQ